MRICVLDEVAAVEDLLCATLRLRHHQPISYQTPLLCLESLRLSMQCCRKQKFDLLIIGDHPQTGFSWRHIVEQVRIVVPELPILLISNAGYGGTFTIEHELTHLKVLDEPFRLKDFYDIVEEFDV